MNLKKIWKKVIGLKSVICFNMMITRTGRNSRFLFIRCLPCFLGEYVLYLLTKDYQDGQTTQEKTF